MSNFILLMAPPEGGQDGGFSSIIFLVLIIAVFYFFMIRPQMKKQKELRNFRNSINKGDKVVTSGGIYGRVTEIQDHFVFLEIDTNVKIKVDKAAILSSPQDLEQKK
jgi:preprotein translocase subunit YajC